MSKVHDAIERTIANKVRNKQARKAQDDIAQRLGFLGFRCIAPIATPMSVVGGKRKYHAKVAGDFYALLHGRGALVEVKRREAFTLSHSDLDPDQHQRLSDWEAGGGYSFLAWVNPLGIDPIAIIPWSIARAQIHGPRTSIAWAVAHAARLTLTR